MSAQATPFFTPTQISGCQFWIDAADSSTVTLAGGTVSSVVDKSANRLTLTGGSSFTYNVTKFQGQYPSFFNNSAAVDAKIGSNASFNLSQPMTIFVTGVMTAGVVDNDMILDGNINRISIYNRTANFFANPSQLSQGFPYLTSPYIVCGFANTTSSSLLVNGTTILSGPIGSSALTSIVVGNRQNGSGSPYKGHFCEFLIYQGLLTTPQRQQIEGYLAWKWGLQSSLPADHPYKTSPIPPLLNPPTSLPLISQPAIPPTTWTPTQVSGCQLWLDAADSSTVVLSGSAVTQWRDKSGAGNNATTFSGTLSYSSSGLAFTGSQSMTTPLTSVLTTQTVFFVGTANSSAGIEMIGVNSPTYLNGLDHYFFNYQQYFTRFGGTIVTLGATVTSNVPFLYTASYISGGSSFLYLNGSQTGSNLASPTISGSGTIMIGAYRDSAPANFYVGTMNEVLLYSTTLSSTQRQQVEGYLAWKWGLQSNLPNSHLYKSYPPFLPDLAAPPRAVAQALGRWNPTQIAGIAMWLDASDISTVVVSGSVVTQWRDKSGSGNNANAYTSNPTLVTNVQNRLPGLLFSGGQALSAGTIATGTNFSLFTAVRYTGGSVSMGFWKVQYSSYLQITKGVNVRARMAATGSATPTFDTGPTLDENPHIIKAIVSSDTVSPSGYVIGGTDGTDIQLTTSGGPNTVSHNASSPFTIGALIENNTAYFFMTGYVHEIVFYRSTLTRAQQQQIEGYLAWKWGLQGNLPANHPFKLWPPPP